MALSADGNWVTQDVARDAAMSLIVLTGSVLYNSALCSHDTTVGEIKPYDGTVTDRLVGWHLWDKKTGNGSGARVKARIARGGFIVKALPVTGLNGTTPSVDYGKPVYASDDGTYTLTGTTATQRVGRVLPDDNSVTVGTDANVLMRDVFGVVGGG